MGEPRQLIGLLYGIRNAAQIPPWWLQMFQAVTEASEWRFRQAILTYAQVFELFIESYLNRRLIQRYDATLSEFLMNEYKGIEQRSTSLLKFVTGRRLGESGTIHQRWQTYVQHPPNQMGHGHDPEKVPLDEDTLTQAHLAVLDAIEWIHELP